MVEHLEVPAGDAGRLRVAFEHVGDRYRHVIGLSSAAEFSALIASVEGDASQAWPPSPPLQQLHFESRGEQGDVALLVGMAGRSHWSLSVEPYQDESRGFTGFIFDAACRCAAAPHDLGSRYVALDGDWRLESPDRAVLESNNFLGCLSIERPSSDASAAGDVGYDLRINNAERSLEINILKDEETRTSFATTARWRYCIVWKSP